MATVEQSGSATDAISYTDLYARWEKGNWSDCSTVTISTSPQAR